MGATVAVHPADPILRAYGLGKLDDVASSSVSRHLERCDSCQRRVAELSSDDFLGRLQNVQLKPDRAKSDWAPSASSSTDGPPGSFVPPPPVDTLPPELVDHPDYEIVRELGRGGMGVVYLAQNNLMGRPEVLKVIGRHLIEPPGVFDRFLREVRSAAKLQHANIVTAYSAMRLGSSVVLTMEYVDGLDLAKIVKTKGPLSIPQACYYIHQVALGLQHAHERGMVHRDIKPANLILARVGKQPIVKVLDFGLAKVTSEGQADTGLTRDGQMLGTPDYIAPEQIRNAQTADIRADIYSLGCTFYHLLTGAPPFRGEHLWDLYQAHFSMDAQPLNLRRPEVPVELAALIAKMMAKEPGRRFQAPHEVAHELKAFFKTAGATRGGLQATLSVTGVTDGVGEVLANPLPPARIRSDAPAASKAMDAEPGAGSVWEGLIDLGEREPLTQAATLTARTMRPTPWASRTMIRALSLCAGAALAITAFYMSLSNNQVKSVDPRPEKRTTAPNTAKSAVVVPHGLASRSTKPGFSSADAVLEKARERFAISSPTANDSDESLPSSVEDIGITGTPALSTTRDAADSSHKPLQKLDLKPGTELKPLVAGELSPIEVLRRFGLIRVGKIYVLEQETEVQRKFNAARPLVDEYSSNIEKRNEIERAAATIHELDRDNVLRDFQISDIDRELRQRPPRPNSDQTAIIDSLTNRRDTLDGERNLAITNSRLLKSQFPNPKQQIRELEVEIDRGRALCRSALDDLDRVIRSTEAKFSDLTKNDEIRTALAKIGSVKLGHIPEYQNMIKWSNYWERFMTLTIEPPSPNANSAAKKKNSVARKR